MSSCRWGDPLVARWVPVVCIALIGLLIGPVAARADSAAPSTTSAPPRSPPSRVLPHLVLATGFVAVIAGSVLWAVDEDPTPQNRAGSTYFDSAPTAIALMAGGALVVSGGVYWWSRVRARERAQARATPRFTPMLMPSRSGALVGVVTAF
jgi:hypothetical protein